MVGAGYVGSHIVPITKDVVQNPINPYSMTKIMVECIFKDYHKVYGLQYVVLRYFNAVGADPETYLLYLEGVESVRKVNGRYFKVMLADRRIGDLAKFVGNSKKAQKVLEWQTVYGGIDKIVEHTRKWRENGKYRI